HGAHSAHQSLLWRLARSCPCVDGAHRSGRASSGLRDLGTADRAERALDACLDVGSGAGYRLFFTDHVGRDAGRESASVPGRPRVLHDGRWPTRQGRHPAKRRNPGRAGAARHQWRVAHDPLSPGPGRTRHGARPRVNALASTRAPGKLVLSGAYSVLEGAPAIVAAVDRYATADGTRPAGFVADEMRAAMQPPYPLIDASALREEGRKLGLGSSAALLVAALSATGEFDLDRRSERYRLFERALAAHRRAQGGGSGIDVAASTFGGTLQYQLPAPLRTLAGHGSPRITPLPLPSNLHVEVWQS